MKAILLIGHNDLRVFLKHKASFVWLFVVPVVFIGFMGYASRGPDKPANARPTVMVDNQDTNYLGAVLMEELGTQGMNVVSPSSSEEAPRKIQIPADFTQRVLSGDQVKLSFTKNGSVDTGEGAMVELRLVRALIAINSHLLNAAAQSDSVLSETAIRQAQHAPPTVCLDARFAGRKPAPTGFNFSLPGNMVTYVLMNLLIFGATAIARQRSSGLIRRMAVNPVTRGQVVAGKIYGLVLLGGVQVAVFLLAGQFLFGVRLGSNLPAILFTMLVYSWVASSLGVLAGSLVRAEDKVVGLCDGFFADGRLCGCWWPLEMAPPAFKVVAHCLPTGWALKPCTNLSASAGAGQTPLAPWPSLPPLAAANFLAARFFRW